MTRKNVDADMATVVGPERVYTLCCADPLTRSFYHAHTESISRTLR